MSHPLYAADVGAIGKTRNTQPSPSGVFHSWPAATAPSISRRTQTGRGGAAAWQKPAATTSTAQAAFEHPTPPTLIPAQFSPSHSYIYTAAGMIAAEGNSAARRWAT